MIRPSFSSTPTKGMEVLFGLPPLLLSVEDLALNTAITLEMTFHQKEIG